MENSSIEMKTIFNRLLEDNIPQDKKNIGKKNDNNNDTLFLKSVSQSLFNGAAQNVCKKNTGKYFNTILLSDNKTSFIVIANNRKEQKAHIAVKDKNPFQSKKQQILDTGDQIASNLGKDASKINGTYSDLTVYTSIKNISNYNKYFYSFDEQDLNKLYQQLDTNFKQSVTKHPYLDEVSKAAENEMKGNKYISVGNPSYVKEAQDYLVRMAFEVTRVLRESGDPQRLLEAAVTEEGTVSKGKSIIEKIYKNKDSEKWEDRDFLDAVDAARDGDQTAIGYLMYKHAPVIFNSYWKNYLGPDKQMRRQKIMNDGGFVSSLYKWIGIALKALIEGGVESKTKTGKDRSKLSTLEGFNEKKVTGKPENAFAAHFKLDLLSQAYDINKEDTRGGITMSDTEAENFSSTSLDWEDGDQKTTEDMVSSDDTFDTAMRSIEDGDFKDNWFDFCQDEELQGGNKKCSRAGALKIMLQNLGETNLAKLADVSGVSRSTYFNLCSDAIKIMQKYGIEKSSLFRACDQYGGKKLASYL